MRIITPCFGDWLRWFFLDLWFIWVVVITLVPIVSFVWGCSWSDAESRARWAGTVLQLLGLAITALGIQQTRKQFGHRTVFESLKAWYARRPQKKVTFVTGTGNLRVEGQDAVMAVGFTAAPAGSSIEERISRLEASLPLIEQRAAAIDQRAISLPPPHENQGNGYNSPRAYVDG